MRRLLKRTALTSAVILASGLITISTLAPPAADGADRPASKLQAALHRAVDAPPRFTPKAPDEVGAFVSVPELKPIQFAFNKADVRTANARVLDADAEWLKAKPELPVLIAGHADERGTDRYNLALAERRAQALRNELVARGVRADRITLVTYGEGMPSCRTHAEPCWATNRAATILVRREGPQRP